MDGMNTVIRFAYCAKPFGTLFVHRVLSGFFLNDQWKSYLHLASTEPMHVIHKKYYENTRVFVHEVFPWWKLVYEHCINKLYALWYNISVCLKFLDKMFDNAYIHALSACCITYTYNFFAYITQVLFIKKTFI